MGGPPDRPLTQHRSRAELARQPDAMAAGPTSIAIDRRASHRRQRAATKTGMISSPPATPRSDEEPGRCRCRRPAATVVVTPSPSPTSRVGSATNNPSAMSTNPQSDQQDQDHTAPESGRKSAAASRRRSTPPSLTLPACRAPPASAVRSRSTGTAAARNGKGRGRAR